MPLGPNQANHPSTPESQALEPLFAKGELVALHHEHEVIEETFEFRQIDSMLGEVLDTLRFIPSNHGQT